MMIRFADENRLAIGALLEAASNPDLSDEQARTLVNEARENSVLANGEWKEITIELMLDQIRGTYLRGLLALDKNTGITD